jgi:hypothetical protein
VGAEVDALPTLDLVQYWCKMRPILAPSSTCSPVDADGNHIPVSEWYAKQLAAQQEDPKMIIKFAYSKIINQDGSVEVVDDDANAASAKCPVMVKGARGDWIVKMSSGRNKQILFCDNNVLLRDAIRSFLTWSNTTDAAGRAEAGVLQEKFGSFGELFKHGLRAIANATRAVRSKGVSGGTKALKEHTMGCSDLISQILPTSTISFSTMEFMLQTVMSEAEVAQCATVSSGVSPDAWELADREEFFQSVSTVLGKRSRALCGLGEDE